MNVQRDEIWNAVYGAMLAQIVATKIRNGEKDPRTLAVELPEFRKLAEEFADIDAEERAKKRGVDRLVLAEMQANTNRIDPSCPGPFDPGGAFGPKP